MYFVVFQNKTTKNRRYVGFMDQEQFQEDYDPESQDEAIAEGVSKEKAEDLCQENKPNSRFSATQAH